MLSTGSEESNRKLKRFVIKQKQKERRKARGLKKLKDEEKERKKEKYSRWDAMTDQQMLDAMRRVGGGKYIPHRKYRELKSEDDPNDFSIYKRFGSWIAASILAFGYHPDVEGNKLKAVVDETYLVRMAHEFKIRTFVEYNKKRRKYPKYVPPRSAVLKYFKTFTIYFKAVRQYSYNEQMMKCMHLKRRLKKMPTPAQMRAEGINYNFLMSRFQTVYGLRDRLNMLEAAEERYERSRGDQGEVAEPDGAVSEREEKETFKPFSDELLS